MLGLTTREVWWWCLIGAAIAFQTDLVCHFNIQSFADVVQGVLDSSAFALAGWLLVLLRAPGLVANRAASMRDVMLACGVALLCAIPTTETVILAVTVLSVTLLVRSEVTRDGAQAGILLAMLAVGQAWHTPYLHPLHSAVAHLDAPLVGWVANHTGHSVVADGKLVGTDAFRIDLFAACSSSMPLADVALGFVVVVIWFRGAFRRADLPWLAASLAVSVMLTQVRLRLLVADEASYEWWHDGDGKVVYPMVALGFAVLMPLLCCIIPIRPRRVEKQTEWAS